LHAPGAGRVQLETAPEQIAKVAADFMVPRRQRRLLPACAAAARLRAWRGRLAEVVEATQECGGYSLEKRMWFYRDFPRIDFEISLDLRRTDTLVTVDFPFAGAVSRRTRGIPFGASEGPPGENWLEPPPYWLARASEHRQFGYSAAVMPALGWSDYRLAAGGGLTLVEDGLAMHEFAPDRLTLGLINAVGAYRGLPNEELRGLGKHQFRFALIPHEGDWRVAEAPRRAREFSSPPLYFEQGQPCLLYTSDAADDSLRVECLVPHRAARRTNLLGEEPQPLARAARYRFAVAPQEIVTLRFELGSAVEAPPALRTWLPLVPESKRDGLRMRIREKGHPPRPF